MGYLGQIQGDGSIEGGDSLSFTCHYIYLTNYKYPTIDFFEVSFGGYVRHPNPLRTYKGFGSHYKNPWNGCISRDQMTPLLAVLIKKKMHKASLRLLLHNSLSLFILSYNTVINGKDPINQSYKIPDPTGPDIWAMYLRMLGPISWLLYPLITILDIHNLLNILWFNYKTKDDDIISLCIKTIACKDFIPTPISYLTYMVWNKNKALSLLKSYWSGWRRQPGLYELYLEKMK